MPHPPSPDCTEQSWTCCGCDRLCDGPPPWHWLCPACLTYFQERGLQPDPDWPKDELPPPCPCCGKRLIPVTAIPAALK
jgi:hypothetical protein